MLLLYRLKYVSISLLLYGWLSFQLYLGRWGRFLKMGILMRKKKYGNF